MSLSKRSPILRPLLKLPRQKLDEDSQDFLESHLLAPIMVLVMIVAMCLVEWAGYLKNSPRNPWIYTWWLARRARPKGRARALFLFHNNFHPP